MAHIYEQLQFDRLSLTDPRVVEKSLVQRRRERSGEPENIFDEEMCVGPNLAAPGSPDAAVAPPAANTDGPAVAGASPRQRRLGGSGFAVYEDATGKPGLITTSPNASITLHLKPSGGGRPQAQQPAGSASGSSSGSGGRFLVVVLGYLSSYRRMAAFDAQLTVSPCACPRPCSGDASRREAPASGRSGSGRTVDEWCSKVGLSQRKKSSMTRRIDGRIHDRVSVYSTAFLALELPTRPPSDGPMPCAFLTVTAAAAVAAGEETGRLGGLKVKLYDVSWAWSDALP